MSATPKPAAKPPFLGFCETFYVELTADGQNVVTAVEVAADGGED